MLVYVCLALHLNQGIKYLVGKEWLFLGDVFSRERKCLSLLQNALGVLS